jgi:hypothetical protein
VTACATSELIQASRTNSRAGGEAQMVEHLPSKGEALSSSPSIAKKKKKKKKKSEVLD